jgi:MFS family permease
MTRTDTSLLAPELRWTTIGANALIFLAAFDALAVTTVMPTVARDLNGENLYSAAFAGTLAASTIGTVAAGGWSDRRGPARPLLIGIVVFLVGLAVSALAPAMGVFIAGRVMQGLGSGAVNVALFVVVARLYPASLHPRVFGTFAAAWVVPSLIGPPVAGLVADEFGWHWVFVGMAMLVVVAGGFVVPALLRLRSTSTPPPEESRGRGNVLLALLVAAAVMAMSITADDPGVWTVPIVVAALAIGVIAVRPLLPRGTMRARRGLPALVLLRGIIAAAFFATEIYLPYLLHERHGLSSAASGLVLTVGAVSWALASGIQGRATRMTHAFALRVSAVLIVAGIGIELLAALLDLAPVALAVGWFVAGGGMGLVFPRLSTLVLGHSSGRDQGFNSAALTIADSAASATATALVGLVFVALGGASQHGAFVAALALTTAIALAAVPVSFRGEERGAALERPTTG